MFTLLSLPRGVNLKLRSRKGRSREGRVERGCVREKRKVDDDDGIDQKRKFGRQVLFTC